MHYFLYPIKDTFVRNDKNFIFKNMGLDEILEVEKRTYPIAYQSTASGQLEPGFGAKDTYLSRAFFYFDLSDISASISSGEITNPKFYLSLKTADVQSVPLSYTLAAYPLAKGWGMGTGYKYDGQQIADGASWKFADGISLKWWASQSLLNSEGGGIWYVEAGVLGSGSGYAQPPYVGPNPYDPFPYCIAPTPTPGPTPTPTPTPTPAPIGTVSGSLVCSQSFSYQTSDVYMDVTKIINSWLTDTVPNYGMIVLHSGESDSIDYGKLRFFSKETNTIYSPHLDVVWDAHTFNTGSGTGSLDELPLKDTVVSIKNMMPEYRQGSVIQFTVTPRTRYPIKTFTNNLSDYIVPYHLPSSSFYSVLDAETREVVIPYDFGTQLSLSPTDGTFFMLDTSGIAQERHYTISIRSEQSGSIVTFEIPTSFKITR